MEKKIFIIKSDRMDTNKKKDRKEDTLLRAAKIVRDKLNLDNANLNVCSLDNTTKALAAITPFQAFSSDIKKARKMYEEGEFKNEKDLERTCFVSSDIFNRFAKDNNKDLIEVVLSDTFHSMLIGTDPELLLLEEGEVINACNIPGMSKLAQFGADGAMAELRPHPAYTPIDLVKNIKDILRNDQFTKNIRQYDWMSACYFENANRDFPVGTHIHFDNPPQIAQLTEGARMRLFAVTNKILDELLTIPMIRLDGTKGHNRRAKCKMALAGNFGNVYGKGYGFFGEWRPCHGRLEYRSLSGLVISDPNICVNVFGTGQAIVEAIYKKAIHNKLNKNYILPEKYTVKGIYGNDFNSWKKIPIIEEFKCIKSSDFMHTVMDKSSRVEVDIKYIKRWLSSMRKLSTYNKYEKHIEALGELLTSSARALDGLNKNIKDTWGIK